MREVLAVIGLLAWYLATGWICLFVVRLPDA